MEARRYATIELFRVDDVREAFFQRPNPLYPPQKAEEIDPGIAYDLGSFSNDEFDSLDDMLDGIRELLDG